jgi:hypothetical protein
MEPNSKTLRQPELVDQAVVSLERADFVPEEGSVRALAHEIYRVRCETGEQGDELADWIAAESELKRSGKDGVQTARTQFRAGESKGAIARNDSREPTA